MMAMKTPGVYVVEKDAFPNSVVEVATAVPAFIGYTEKANNGGNNLIGKPWRITSMSEFERYFGGTPKIAFELKRVDNPDTVTVKPPADGDAVVAGAEKAKKNPAKEIKSDEKSSSGETFTVSTRGGTIKYTLGTANGPSYRLYYSMQLFSERWRCLLCSICGNL